jgi:HEPN domain-containing protein
LKAWLVLLGKQYPVTHNLDQLLRELKKAGVKMPNDGKLVLLNPFAVQFRYETMDLSEPELDRKGLLKVVGGLVERVQTIMGGTEKGSQIQESPAPYRIPGLKMKVRKKKGGRK